ncbi:UNVERIFIED_CONTAM: hypothetical protein K2H54_054866 [Gekko kuhli]
MTKPDWSAVSLWQRQRVGWWCSLIVDCVALVSMSDLVPVSSGPRALWTVLPQFQRLIWHWCHLVLGLSGEELSLLKFGFISKGAEASEIFGLSALCGVFVIVKGVGLLLVSFKDYVEGMALFSFVQCSFPKQKFA